MSRSPARAGPESAQTCGVAGPPRSTGLWRGGLFERRPRQPGDELQRVAVVELSERLIGQSDAVQLPERVVIAVIVEVLVVGLEYAPVVRIFVGLIAVFPEENPVLILEEKVARGARLAADIVQDGGNVVVRVRILIEQLAGAREVVGVPPEVRQDELRVRMLADH